MSDWLLETIIKGIEELENEKKNPGWFSVSAISNVPYIQYPGLTEEECVEIQEQTKNVLRYSRNLNGYGEVAIAYDITDNSPQKYKIAFGNENRIKIMDEFPIKDFICSNNESNRLVAVCIHNHPNSSGFSVSDLFLFSQNPCIKIMAIVNKEGQVSFLMREKAINLCNIVLNNIIEYVPDFANKVMEHRTNCVDFSLSDIIEKKSLKRIVENSLNDFEAIGVLYKSYLNNVPAESKNISNNIAETPSKNINNNALEEQKYDEYLENGEDSYEWEFR